MAFWQKIAIIGLILTTIKKRGKKKMGLTFKRQDDLEKMFDKFASIPDPKKDAGKGKGDEEEKQEKGKQKPKK